MGSAKVSRFQTVDAIRGIAALTVCLLHMTGKLFPAEFLRILGTHGGYGVEVFFIITGFILPYVMFRVNYKLWQYGVFVLKRVLRLDPPYFFTILLIVPLGYLATITPGFKGPPYDVSLPQVLLHFAYLNIFFGYAWLNPVFWTLAIEFQYYLLLGLFFPLIAHKRAFIRVGFMVLMAASALMIPDGRFAFHYLFTFMMGMLVFQFYAGLISKRSFFIWLPVLAGGVWYTLGPLIAMLGTLTAGGIVLRTVGNNFLSRLGEKIENRFLLFMGNISYSLYLIHVPVGMKIVNLGSRFAHGTLGNIVVMAVALGGSIVAAYAMYRLVELPAQRWSAAIGYRPAEPKPPQEILQQVESHPLVRLPVPPESGAFGVR